MFYRITPLAFGFVLSALTGCGPADKIVPVFPVRGSITFQGKPPVGAQVLLSPVSKQEVLAAPLGRVKEDGSFQISTFGEGDGAPPGEYVATVQWFRPVSDGGGSGPGPNVIPKQYARPSTSPIKVTVKSEPNVLPAIVIR